MNEKQAHYDLIRNHQIGGKEDGITPEAAYEQGLINTHEFRALNGEAILDEGPVVVPPTEATLKHWSEVIEAIEANGEKRLYAVGENGEYFAYTVCTSERLDRNMEMLYQKASDTLHEARQIDSDLKVA